MLTPHFCPFPSKPAPTTTGCVRCRRRRVLVAIEPIVLEGAFATILELIGLDEVVQFQSATNAERGGHYDAAIVSAGFQDEARAEVVIILPNVDVSGGARRQRRGHIVTPEVTEDVDIDGQREVIHLLDRHAPTVVSRRDRLLTAQGRLAP